MGSLFIRLFDVFVALVLGLVLLPVILLVALLILVFMGSPVLFVQVRPGLSGVGFKLYKFRTMSCGDSDDAVRLTGLGKWLRRFSLDELPQLWNVLCGHMSLVGPRPLLMEYLPLYDDVQRQRMDVKPGVTGWAQVNGRNAISWEQKFEYDVWYVQHQSFLLNLKILLMTCVKVIRGVGVQQQGHVTMEKFKGTIHE